jgi:hypothetical protein
MSVNTDIEYNKNEDALKMALSDIKKIGRNNQTRWRQKINRKAQSQRKTNRS